MYTTEGIQKIIDGSIDEAFDNLDDRKGVFEKIADKDGHLRFVDGEGIIGPNQTAITSDYCKWSLSGSHLMFVFAGTIADEGQPADEYLAKFELPKWILDKIFPVWSNYIEAKTISLKATDWTEQTMTVVLGLASDNINIQPVQRPTMTANRHFRIQFDLLIDNE